MQCEWLEYDLKRECGSSIWYNCSFPDHPERPSARLGDLTSVGMLMMTLWELIQQFAGCKLTFKFLNGSSHRSGLRGEGDRSGREARTVIQTDLWPSDRSFGPAEEMVSSSGARSGCPSLLRRCRVRKQVRD